MEKHVIWRGVLAGALAGVFAFVWSKIFIEPIVGRAIDFEDGTAAAHEAMSVAHGGHSHGEDGGELFSRGIQSNIGMGLGVLLFSVAMGALFAVVFCVAYGRLNNLSARTLSVLIAGGMLISLWIVPSLKYPPNPPATSLDETITQRALLYLLMVGLSALFMVSAAYLGHQLAPKLGAWNATLAAGGAYIVAVALLMLILPTINETPGPIEDDGHIVFPGFPAVDLYEFRLYALGTQVIIWTTIGLVGATMLSRLLDGKRESVAA
ncbi:cobalt transporter [Mycolicibacterium fortuitum]|uniref:Putative cobalt transporter subunit (CbtA) n=1 Tax=Mycolicibacterium fortuitum TaxID=1766 RepID=A0A378UYJ8_MYCFO|nr:CbtA family protein [Mycolicibacterium fortuitum]OBG54810.1 cobalt transporter [Mycolicibacterium fortuitum]OBK61663.1 cobalt transporter [Mycolicibacterium fortuitum]SUA02647.1 putative cobalt transporter subunit (CbtA) [Mycolicibacterium fortuitum]